MSTQTSPDHTRLPALCEHLAAELRGMAERPDFDQQAGAMLTDAGFALDTLLAGGLLDEPRYAVLRARLHGTRNAGLPNSGARRAFVRFVEGLRALDGAAADWPATPDPGAVDPRWARRALFAVADWLGMRATADGPAAAVAAADDESVLSPAQIARRAGVPLPALQKRLERWRKQNAVGWIENTEHGSHEARYLYRAGAVRPVVAALKTSNERPAKKI